MSGQHCESYDVKRETVHCYPVNSSLLTAVARDGWNLCAVFKFCFCFVLLYNKSLYDWSLGEQWILFPSNLNVSLHFVSGNIEIFGKQIHSSPRDQSLSVYYLTAFHYFRISPLVLERVYCTIALISHVEKVKSNSSAHSMADVIPFLTYLIFPPNPTPR